MTDKTHLFRSSAGIDHWMVTEGGKTRFAASQDVEPFLEWNKAARNHNDGYTPSRDARRVASIPYIIMQKWRDEEGWNAMDAGHDPDVARKLMQKLNSSEYAFLRTADGQLGIRDGRIS